MRTWAYHLALIGPGLVFLSCDSGVVCGEGTIEENGVCIGETLSEDVDSATPDDSIPKPALVYLLAGQSNMVGLGRVTALPPSLRMPQEDVQLYWSRREGWNPLQPSSGVSSSWGMYMGPEVSFGRAIKDAHPDRDVYLIKHANSGTALADWWNPGTEKEDTAGQGQGYKTFRKTVVDGLAALDGAQVSYEVAGMIWMQGESDAAVQAYASAYETNLTHFISRMRDDVGVPDLPFIIGEIHCLGVCTHRDEVVAAERAVAVNDQNVRSFETLDLERFPTDYWHYNGIGQRVLGQRFAESMVDSWGLSPFPEAAIEITGSYTYLYAGAFTVGWAFTTSQDLRVTDMGVFDLDDDGLYHSTLVAIWEARTEAVVLQADVYNMALSDTTWHKGFRYVGVEPLFLPAGDYVIGNVSYLSAPDYYVFEAGITESSAVDWLGSRHKEGTTLSFPGQISSTSEESAAWFGPNFLFERVVGIR